MATKANLKISVWLIHAPAPFEYKRLHNQNQKTRMARLFLSDEIKWFCSIYFQLLFYQSLFTKTISWKRLTFKQFKKVTLIFIIIVFIIKIKNKNGASFSFGWNKMIFFHFFPLYFYWSLFTKTISWKRHTFKQF